MTDTKQETPKKKRDYGQLFSMKVTHWSTGGRAFGIICVNHPRRRYRPKPAAVGEATND